MNTIYLLVISEIIIYYNYFFYNTKVRFISESKSFINKKSILEIFMFIILCEYTNDSVYVPVLLVFCWLKIDALYYPPWKYIQLFHEAQNVTENR